MRNFISSVVLDLYSKQQLNEQTIFILPSKRAGVFLKYELLKVLNKPMIAPRILSIETFVEELSSLRSIPQTELLFTLYQTYLELTEDEVKEPFETFSNWAQMILQDFNEIDRYNIDHEKIFDYLKAIKELEHWSLEPQKTELIDDHLKFWKQLKDYYTAFTTRLIKQKQGYQGLIYRAALNNVSEYIKANNAYKHIFLGFNALNTCESNIIQSILEAGIADVYWDIDERFLNDTIHDAGLFIRAYLKQWPFFKTTALKWPGNNYNTPKDIQVIGIAKQVGQAKYIGQLLNTLSKDKGHLQNTAVILGEEGLLMPVLNAIPECVNKINVTMGLALKDIPLASLFNQLFNLHKNPSEQFYYKNVIAILSHPALSVILDKNSEYFIDKTRARIEHSNKVHLHIDDIKSHEDDQNNTLITLLFCSWYNKPNYAIGQCNKLIALLKANMSSVKNPVYLEYLYRFHTLFNQLEALNHRFNYIQSIEGLEKLYSELLNNESLDFQGEPLDGLQIMGVLESRALDFDTVIISGVNEGILPAGKTNNSFIPFDVKKENGLPTFKEKDAVYTYHFYRLIQRAKQVYILYNTEIDALKGGEKSRFITQLDIEGVHQIKHQFVSSIVPVIKHKPQSIFKNEDILQRLKYIASRGFSPSSLTNYIRNPIDFYYQKILGLKPHDAVEEHIAANTLGSAIHNTLEDFYKPIEGQYLTIEYLKDCKSNIVKTVGKHFDILYKDGSYKHGKNLIIFEIAQRYIYNFLDYEIRALQNNNTIKILAIEVDETITTAIKGVDFPVKFTGKIDRVDQYNGVTRIIDYKSGKVEQNKVEIVDWSAITQDYDNYSKPFQLLLYAYMMYKANTINLPVEAGIISFKNLKGGLLKFATKPSVYSKNKQYLITEDTLNEFENQLQGLIVELMDANLDFIEKQIE